MECEPKRYCPVCATKLAIWFKVQQMTSLRALTMALGAGIALDVGLSTVEMSSEILNLCFLSSTNKDKVRIYL